MVLVFVFCVVRAVACAVVVLLCTQREKKSPHGAQQQKCEYLANQIFPSKNQKKHLGIDERNRLPHSILKSVG